MFTSESKSTYADVTAWISGIGLNKILIEISRSTVHRFSQGVHQQEQLPNTSLPVHFLWLSALVNESDLFLGTVPFVDHIEHFAC